MVISRPKTPPAQRWPRTETLVRPQPDSLSGPPTDWLEWELGLEEGETQPPRSAETDALPELPSGDRYTFQSELARGGMGSVFLVRDNHLGRTVAMKRLLTDSPSAADARRFLREAQITGQLEHPSVVTVHEVGVDEAGRPYYTMPWIRGGTTLEELIDLLRQGDADAHARWPLRRRVEVVISVARALQAAHAKGVIHRDVKPANVMVGRHGEVVLLDWGLAKHTGAGDSGPSASPFEGVTDPAHTDPNLIMGTPLYMAPEQMSGSADARSDVYALSALLWELVSLRHYLGQPSSQLAAVLRAVRHDPPNLDRSEQVVGSGRVPALLAKVVERGLAKRPADRLASASVLIEQLEDWLAGTSPVDCPSSLCVRGLADWRRLLEEYPQVVTMVSLAVPPLAVMGLVQLVRLATG